MTDRRGVRSSSRRKNPLPRPPSAAATPQPALPRRRATRSVSREPEHVSVAAKPTRRGARQASVASESEHEARPPQKSKQKSQNQAPPALATVEEVDSQLAIHEAPQTPTHSQKEVVVPHRSPGTVSEMSGTTAISSASQFEAEDLESRFILRRLRTLYTTSEEFLAHLVPDDGQRAHDAARIQEMQKPDSNFNKDYRFYESDMNLHLSHFRHGHSEYVSLRAVHRALMGLDRDPSSMRSPIDLLLYKANLLHFAKQGITLDREKEDTWNFLLRHDKIFPSMLLSALIPRDNGNIERQPGESVLLEETFEWGLELRTQLFIVALERALDKPNESPLDPDGLLEDIFLQSSSDGNDFVTRGWDIPGLGGKSSQLPEVLSDKIIERVEAIRKHFPTDTQSLEHGRTVDFEELTAEFPFDDFVLQLLHWVRLRNREIEGSVRILGGITPIVRMIEGEASQSNDSRQHPAAKLSGTPRKKRVSFGRDRQRSSRKFDPRAPADPRALDALFAKEDALLAEDNRGEHPNPRNEDRNAEAIQKNPIIELREHDEWEPTPNGDEPQPKSLGTQVPSASDPARTKEESLKIVLDGRKQDKENRGGFFASQPNAERIEFGSGFEETQVIAGPSNKSKGKQPQRESPRKRRRPVDDEESDDGFETEQRNARVQERRHNAPVIKKVRLGPSSSAPTSHQPAAGDVDEDYIPNEQEDSLSEREAPEMTEEAPQEAPPSSYALIKSQARSNRTIPIRREHRTSRKPRVDWTEEAEIAFIEYMGLYPHQYSRILEHDKSTGRHLLEGRSQVNLKDKARNMAVNMIK
ncbi:hypothetical protein CC78DRAFT_32782 [Lojkania enalia]|uniref:Myb-like domain-containing protein n=1 Tax=Lojkania enalia TaxID=147567 RepID=A0A9P4N820_9PLEO|nr:hypothetical protein CC78DRAFT_32782 [Didymosphaeria enalia]